MNANLKTQEQKTGFELSYDMLNDIINSELLKISDKERKYRKEKLNKAYNQLNIDTIDYYSIAHEIRTMELFSNMGNTKISEDSKDEPGADFKFDNNYIECVCASAGVGNNYNKIRESGYEVYDKVVDGNLLNNQIYLRAISSLDYKTGKHRENILKGVNTKKYPFCIFLSMGPLMIPWIPGQMCRKANSFLVGMGHPIITFDKKTGNQIGQITHGYVNEIKNNNNSPVITNFFGCEQNSEVSAVIISNAYVHNRYSKDNVVIFKNPIAKKQIDISKFKDIPYWTVEDDGMYNPVIEGEKVELNFNIF